MKRKLLCCIVGLGVSLCLTMGVVFADVAEEYGYHNDNTHTISADNPTHPTPRSPWDVDPWSTDLFQDYAIFSGIVF